MTEVNFNDVGGFKINPSDLMTDEVIGFIKNINPNIGTPSDPHYGEYTKFTRELEENEILTISMDDIEDGSQFDDMDFSGEEVEELGDDYFAQDPNGHALSTEPLNYFNMLPEFNGGKSVYRKIDKMEFLDDELIPESEYLDYWDVIAGGSDLS